MNTLFNVEAFHQESPPPLKVFDPSWVELEKKLEAITIGDTITTRSGEAIVTRDEQAGNRRILWADYGSGVEHPHIQENLLSTEQLEVKPEPTKRQRRHSKKGAASGWIEERIGNKKRKNLTTSYYYCWLAEDGQRMKLYVSAADVSHRSNGRCSMFCG